MELQRLFQGDPSRNATVYLAIGAISLAKAIALRDDRQRFRRELMDAGLFIGVGLLLRRYSQMKAQKEEELRESLPSGLVDAFESGGGSEAVLDAVQRFRSGSEPEPEPSLGDRARRVVSDRR